MFRNIANSILLSLIVCSSAVFAAALTSSDANFWHQKACNFGGAWDKGYSGNGVLVGVIDDSVQMDHPAYSARIVNGKCRFYVNGSLATDTTGSNPRLSSDTHGTAVTGCIAANSGQSVYMLGRNGIVAGAAYDANLIGVGVDLQLKSITAAFSYLKDQGVSVINNSYGNYAGFAGFGGTVANSFGIIDDGDASYNSIPQIHAAANNGAIILFSAGNNREGDDVNPQNGKIFANQRDSNKKETQACVDTITVAATGAGGSYNASLYQGYADFSCYGANVFCCAPGAAVTTSDRTGSDGYVSLNPGSN